MRKPILLIVALAGSGYLSANDSGITEYEHRAMERAHLSAEAVRENFKASLAESQGGKCRIDPAKAGAMKVGRTSTRLRSPLNTPPKWVEPYLEKYGKLAPGKVPKAQLVRLPNGKLGYVEPIFIEPICLRCHGEKLSPGVREDLKKYYPRDAAVNYKLGDLRGLLWLEWEAPADAANEEVDDYAAVRIMAHHCAGCHQAAGHPGARLLDRKRLSETETIKLIRKLIDTQQMPPIHQEFKASEDGKLLRKWLETKEKETSAGK